jgi:glutamate dehydrogenase
MPTHVSIEAGIKGDDPKQLTDDLMEGLRETAEEVVPWFVEQMPLVYFQDTDPETRLGHLRAIIAARASGQPPKLTLRSEDGLKWTMIRPLDYPGVLAELVHELPQEPALRSAKIHTAADGKLVLDVFEFGAAEGFNEGDARQREKLERTIEYAQRHAPEWSEQEIRAHFKRCSAEYILTVTPLRMAHHWKLWKSLSGTDGTTVDLEREADPSLSRIIVAVGNSRTRTMLERIATRLSRYGINIHRAYLDLMDDPGNGQIGILGFVAQSPQGGAIDKSSELWQQVRRDLLRIKWIDDATLQLSDQHPELGLTRAEALIALCNLVHQVLVKTNPYAFARDRIFRLADRHIAQGRQIVDLFIDRFNPERPLDQVSYESRAQNIRAEINSEVDLEDARLLLERLLDAVDATLRTNIFLEERYALSMRIDPAFLASPEREEIPYGVFFIHGRSFNAFHVRFRDIARGGVRAVRPLGFEQHTRESERLYDEAYGLAFAQQLKNKDIPEGGAKAVILIEPGNPIHRCFKAFADGLLDLITPDPAVRGRIIDRFGQEEIIYLGPDENITPDMIEWIVERAGRRGYALPNSFMSSKPGAGINHKEYGVTSEGVSVFLEVALKAVGIDPRSQPFTVKITGGPDGDVAGNSIRILNREYGENARIVGIADGSGSGEDPSGLDHQELMRLFSRGEPIAFFDRSKLSRRGRIVSVDEPDGFHLRNTLHNRVIADAFLPAGGRPRTIHEGNWKQFLAPGGAPSAKVIVEGANLFLAPEARRELSDAGALIFKDSSANKCGVICSSFEISASMVLSTQEFLSIKKDFVAEVLVKLRDLARREAELLLRERRRSPQTPLPDTSVRISKVMNRAADAIEASFAGTGETDMELLRTLVTDHLPRVLVDFAGLRLWERLPLSYTRWLIAKSLAARIVYKEGLDFLEDMPMAAIAETAVRYLRQERETKQLRDEVLASPLAHRDRVAELLDRGGTRAGLAEPAASGPASASTN